MGRGKTKKHPARRPKGAAAVRSGEVRQPKWIMGIGIVGGGFFLALLVLSGLQGAGLQCYVGFSALMLLSASLIIAPLTEKLTYDPEGFTYRNFFGISRRYRYSEITDLTVGANNVSIYCGDRAVRLSTFSHGIEAFLSSVRCPRNRGRTQEMGTIRRFCYHVDDGGAILVLFGILFAGVIGCMVWVASGLLPVRMEDLTEKHVVFTSTGSREAALELYTDGDPAPYLLRGEPEEELQRIRLREAYVVYYLDEEVDEEAFHDIAVMQDADGNTLRSLEETNHENLMALLTFEGMFLCFLLALIWMTVRVIRIGANPERYSQKVKNRWFKPGALIE